MEEIGFIKLPLYGKDGIGKCTLVDADYDGEYFGQYKWRLMPTGYVARKDGNKLIYLHREATGSIKGMWVEHINKDKLDNRSCNLRLQTPSQICTKRKQRQGKNNFRGIIQSSSTRTNKDGEKVKYVYDSYLVRVAGKKIGWFDNKAEAAKAYNKEALKRWGKDAILNVVE